MLLLLFMLSVSSECGAQFYMYGGPVPFRRAPVRRSPMEALERLRAPARYFPQVDYAEEGGAYALPPQWTDALYGDDPTNDEDEYEYEAQPLAPVYRTPVDTYPEESYGDLMRSYLMAPPPPQQPPVFLQRRSDSIPLPNSTPAAPPQTAVPTSSAPPPPKKEEQKVQSLVLQDPVQSSGPSGGGQKEEPLFRPLHSSQRTTGWQSPIPMLKQMIQSKQEQKDPLLEELSSLKKV